MLRLQREIFGDSITKQRMKNYTKMQDEKFSKLRKLQRAVDEGRKTFEKSKSLLLGDVYKSLPKERRSARAIVKSSECLKSRRKQTCLRLLRTRKLQVAKDDEGTTVMRKYEAVEKSLLEAVEKKKWRGRPFDWQDFQKEKEQELNMTSS